MAYTRRQRVMALAVARINGNLGEYSMMEIRETIDAPTLSQRTVQRWMASDEQENDVEIMLWEVLRQYLGRALDRVDATDGKQAIQTARIALDMLKSPPKAFRPKPPPPPVEKKRIDYEAHEQHAIESMVQYYERLGIPMPAYMRRT